MLSVADSKELLKQQKVWLGCQKQPTFFAEHFWYINHPSRKRIKFELRDPQREALVAWTGGDDWLTLKARQIGWSTLVAFYVVWFAMFFPDSRVILLSRTEREAIKLLEKAKYGYKFLPRWMRRRCSLTNRHQTKMEFSNGSSIESMPSANDPARGESVSLVVVDEWAFLPNGEEAWASIEPIADIGGQIIGLSTANGVGNFFHDLWVGAEEGQNGFRTMFYGWDAVPERDEEWYARQKKKLPDWQLHQEYPRNAEEAFIRSGRPVFNHDSLAAQPIKDPWFVGSLTHSGDLAPSEQGPLRIWEPLQAGSRYVMGVDVAEGLAHGDFSSMHVIRVKTGEVVAHWHGHTDPDELAVQARLLGLYYGGAILGVEVNNHGLTTVTSLRKLAYPALFRRREMNKTTNKHTLEYGFRTTAITKPFIIDALAANLRDGAISLYDDGTLRELRTYQTDDRGRMGGTPHDDRVISLALANYMLTFAYEPEYQPKRDTFMTASWWRKQGLNDDRSSWIIGGNRGTLPHKV
jgi:hypothetical protein